jgi:excisionase family DNA binding protein
VANYKEIDPMLTVSDVARLLNIHINTVRRWSNQGVLKAYRVGSRGDRRFRRDDIARFLSRESKIAEVEEENPSPLTRQASVGDNKSLAANKI